MELLLINLLKLYKYEKKHIFILYFLTAKQFVFVSVLKINNTYCSQCDRFELLIYSELIPSIFAFFTVYNDYGNINQKPQNNVSLLHAIL